MILKRSCSKLHRMEVLDSNPLSVRSGRDAGAGTAKSSGHEVGTRKVVTTDRLASASA